MENNIFKKNRVLGINIIQIMSLIPLILFAYYKNGWIVYKNGYISLFLSLQYLIIPIIIIVLSYVFDIYYYLGIKKEKDWRNVINSIAPFANVLCYLVCGPRDYLWLSIPLIAILDIILKFVNNKLTINQVALFKCLLFLILTILGTVNSANLYELNSNLNPTLTNYFIGNVIGGIGTTSLLFIIVGFIILMLNSYYKKEIPIISILSYIAVSVIIYFVGGLTFNELLTKAFASGFIFVAIFIAPISLSSPVVKSGSVVYAILIGILSSIFVNILNFNIGIYIIVLITSLLVPLFNKFKLSIL